MADSEPAEGPTPPPAETLGEMLRAARLAQELTVEQVAAELRIEAAQLAALEDNSFERIGVPVFVKGYLRQYGQRLGVNVNDLLALYYQQTTLGDVQIRPNRTIKLRDERQITSWVLAVIVLLSLIVGFAVWWWSDGTLEWPTIGAGAISLTPTKPSGAPAAAAAVRPEPVAAARQPNPEFAAPAEIPAPVATAAPTAGAAPTATVEAEPAPGGGAGRLALELAFAAESWAEINDARGERLLFGLYAAGRRVTVRGEPPFTVVLGNADDVTLLVDGAPFAIPTLIRQDGLARFSVDVAEE